MAHLLFTATLLAAARADQVAVDAAGRQTTSQSDMIARSRGSACADTRPDCEELAGDFLRQCGSDPDLLRACARTCGTCSYLSLIDEAMDCADTMPECANWASIGECEKNPKFMLQGCATSCGSCEGKKVGCARANSTAPISAPGGLNDMFESALADFPELEPVALSRDPWVLQFENLLTKEEADAVVEACSGRFERSLAGDQLSPVRTSTQCWCDERDGCMRVAAVEELTRRMLNVTRLPYNNAEYFQVLRYEPGQFYRAHHDQQSGHWTPQGVRVYTFFVYLSDVEEGGGTRFTDLGITVTPKLGRGILWPSVLDADLRTSDMRTNHEALPVVKGVKLAANLWQHLFDFKTPSRSGLCVFLGKNSNHN